MTERTSYWSGHPGLPALLNCAQDGPHRHGKGGSEWQGLQGGLPPPAPLHPAQHP